MSTKSIVAAVVFLDSCKRVSSKSLRSGTLSTPSCSVLAEAAPATCVRSANSVRLPTPLNPTIPAFIVAWSLLQRRYQLGADPLPRSAPVPEAPSSQDCTQRLNRRGEAKLGVFKVEWDGDGQGQGKFNRAFVGKTLR